MSSQSDEKNAGADPTTVTARRGSGQNTGARGVAGMNSGAAGAASRTNTGAGGASVRNPNASDPAEDQQAAPSVDNTHMDGPAVSRDAFDIETPEGGPSPNVGG